MDCKFSKTIVDIFMSYVVVALITPDEVPTLQTLGIGGEVLTPEVCTTWADEAHLVNVCVTRIFRR